MTDSGSSGGEVQEGLLIDLSDNRASPALSDSGQVRAQKTTDHEFYISKIPSTGTNQMFVGWCSQRFRLNQRNHFFLHTVV